MLAIIVSDLDPAPRKSNLVVLLYFAAKNFFYQAIDSTVHKSVGWNVQLFFSLFAVASRTSLAIFIKICS